MRSWAAPSTVLGWCSVVRVRTARLFLDELGLDDEIEHVDGPKATRRRRRRREALEAQHVASAFDVHEALDILVQDAPFARRSDGQALRIVVTLAHLQAAGRASGGCKGPPARRPRRR